MVDQFTPKQTLSPQETTDEVESETADEAESSMLTINEEIGDGEQLNDDEEPGPAVAAAAAAASAAATGMGGSRARGRGPRRRSLWDANAGPEVPADELIVDEPEVSTA